MNLSSLLKLKKSILFVFLFTLSLNTFAQTTYKVVCDKTDSTVKVIKSDNRSPNYVPIKGGFPFRQIAQQWIDDNYSTTTCNPEEIVKQIQSQVEKSTQVQNNTQNIQPVQPAGTKLQPSSTVSNQPLNYKKSSFLMNAKFSNLGEAFMLSEKLMPGFEVGIEKTFGAQIYFGTGINVDFYLSDMDGRFDVEIETIYFHKN